MGKQADTLKVLDRMRAQLNEQDVNFTEDNAALAHAMESVVQLGTDRRRTALQFQGVVRELQEAVLHNEGLALRNPDAPTRYRGKQEAYKFAIGKIQNMLHWLGLGDEL